MCSIASFEIFGSIYFLGKFWTGNYFKIKQKTDVTKEHALKFLRIIFFQNPLNKHEWNKRAIVFIQYETD